MTGPLPRRARVARVGAVAAAVALLGATAGLAIAQQAPAPAAPAPATGDAPRGDAGRSRPDFPPFDQVIKDFEKVISTADGKEPLYDIYIDRKKNQMLAVLPQRFDGQRIFIATSIAGGSRQTGWQWNDLYGYWKRIDDQLVLMEPNLQRQARGGKQDAELRSAVERTYSDRVVLSTKILAMAPGNRPVIDLDELLVKNSRTFTGMQGNAALATIGSVKAFPQNIEIPITMPIGGGGGVPELGMRGSSGGELVTLHYSISTIPKTDYKPRESDERIGYFLTVFKDFTKNEPGGNQFTRYINRWNLKKRDPSLAMSPPEEPIVFYVEHTVPVRYRRWVRDGILEWNKAFAKVGILDAIEVRQQDAQTGAFMDLQPEDVRYNFFRWISSETPFAMGPSRVNPETGQILDADIIFDDAMLKNYALQYKAMIAAYGLDGIDPKAVAWIQENPSWDPMRIGERPDPLREEILNDPELTDEQKASLLGDPIPMPSTRLLSRVVQQNLACSCALGCAMQMQTAGLAMRLMGDELFGAASDGPMIDGVPEEYLGTILKYITAHEVGHTLGLRHNFKAAAWLSVDDYLERRGEPNVASVMDYVPIYVPPTAESPRGEWMPVTIGPYDYWAIEYGYTFDENRVKEMGKESARTELRFSTDEDASGPDPLVGRWILGSDPLDWARARMLLVRSMRERLLEKGVSENEPWFLLRRGYEQMLGEQVGALRVAGRYLGGVEINRDRKGTPDGREPLVPTPADKQREALQFIIENAFGEEAFDIRPEVLSKLVTDKHRHWGNFGGTDEVFSVHDRIGQVQAFALLFVLNPGTLGRIHDNELRKAPDVDAVTLPEVMRSVIDAVYVDLAAPGERSFTNRSPMLSSIRRNLQSMALDRLISLASTDSMSMPRPVRTLALMHLSDLDRRIGEILAAANGGLDDYTRAHLIDMKERIDRAMNVIRVSNAKM
ncbi:MAG TPA: zinc-dependent metalloprotease [Phycisphaerales bacterium]|nr:zinc-dependent metalloprotease [Phycisphaerales bacterium]HMP36123.1 zinc-dependent metalloprotease [Phycisphaerales bacterium]